MLPNSGAPCQPAWMKWKAETIDEARLGRSDFIETGWRGLKGQ